ncbi:hypothetical protein BP00DRAFT_80398 [Aspergillus indologenus CBS 114.80]|uniref:Uncharacterized protein n=1 Tax=Aspergillus indologenus CBS 114.80 TaxID=1450541 RepID=A0A2V5HUZ8_9EURO|nr:hypothetical protein BP00DRAFT_80398 [Aspergillus indologenus CBS 114.80]
MRCDESAKNKLEDGARCQEKRKKKKKSSQETRHELKLRWTSSKVGNYLTAETVRHLSRGVAMAAHRPVNIGLAVSCQPQWGPPSQHQHRHQHQHQHQQQELPAPSMALRPSVPVLEDSILKPDLPSSPSELLRAGFAYCLSRSPSQPPLLLLLLHLRLRLHHYHYHYNRSPPSCSNLTATCRLWSLILTRTEIP